MGCDGPAASAVFIFRCPHREGLVGERGGQLPAVEAPCPGDSPPWANEERSRPSADVLGEWFRFRLPSTQTGSTGRRENVPCLNSSPVYTFKYYPLGFRICAARLSLLNTIFNDHLIISLDI